MRTAVFAESWWVGKTFEPYDYALGNNNAAARLETINNEFLFIININLSELNRVIFTFLSSYPEQNIIV